MLGIIVLVIFGVLSYIIGCAVLNAMHVMIIGSLRTILIKPLTVGATILLIAGFVLMFVFKGIVLLLGWLLNVVLFCAPIIAIICLIIVIVKIIKENK
jgi:hypothetical protein